MKARALWFTAPYSIEIRDQDVPPPGPGEVFIQATCSAVSPGTEKLIYTGAFPTDLLLDDHIPHLMKPFAYPLQYGYALVGKVASLGEDVGDEWFGRRVFAFHPHQSAAVLPMAQLRAVPHDVADEDVAFLALAETAVTLAMDGRPGIGERVVIFGQGAVGLLLTSVLSRFPLERLVVVDPVEARRTAARQLGADEAVAPGEFDASAFGELRADLAYELSGRPEVLDQAVAAAGFAGRVVVGSWYGAKRAPINLGGRFHRDRITIASSQVSTIPPYLAARWDTARRIRAAWDAIRCARPSRLLTSTTPLDAAGSLYAAMLSGQPGEIAALLTYPS